MSQPPETAPDRRAECEARFVAALPELERAVALIATRQCLSRVEQEDLASAVKLALIENGYAALDQFEGRSSLRTFLVTVAHRLLIDQRRHDWGRWRPSAVAGRLGAVAVRLEELLYKEGLQFDDAAEAIRTRFGAAHSHEELLRIAGRLPIRPSRRALAETAPVNPSTNDGLNPEFQLEGTITAARTQALIDDTVSRLDAQDRIVLRLRFEDDLSVADISRTLGLDQKQLYRRIERLLATFRQALEARGLGWDELRRMIDRGQCHLRLPPEPREESRPSRPSEERTSV